MPKPFIGRKSELLRLEESVKKLLQAIANRFIAGEAGAGKSTLVKNSFASRKLGSNLLLQSGV